MKWPFSSKSITRVQKTAPAPRNRKSAGGAFMLPSNWLMGGGNYGTNNIMTIRRALKYYDDVAPVATAVDWINDEFKTLPLVLKTDKVIKTNHALLDKLRRPNDDMTQQDFLESLGAYYTITNECYIMATGKPGKPPAELIIISPEFVSVFQGNDGFIKEMRVQQLGGIGQMLFTRAENEYRFYNSDDTAELWQIKGLAVLSDGLYTGADYVGSNIMPVRGRSKLSSIHNEINQYSEIAMHNLAMLDNGLLPSGTLTMPDNESLSEDQFEDIEAQVLDYYAGSKNAGKVLILENGLKFTPMGLTPKDMNFEKLTRTVTMVVFGRYKVPLPLVSPDNMTMANMEVAKLNLYDNCVIPLAARLLQELTNFLGERYGLEKNTLLAANLDDVPCMQMRHAEQMAAKKKLDIYSPNDLREMDGAKPITKDGYDDVYQPWTLVPVGTPPVPQQPSSSNPGDKPLLKNFIAILSQQKDIEGKRMFTDDEIVLMANRQGIR